MDHLLTLLRAAAEDTRLRILALAVREDLTVSDYVHVLDIAEAHVLALEYLLRGGASCSLNLANARGYSVKDVIATADDTATTTAA